MRVRIDSYNAFAEFLRLPGRYDRQPPAAGDYLSLADTERLLHDLAVRRPIHANAATAIRTAAVAALVADTGRNVPELARLNVSALQLDGEAHVDLADGSCPLSGATVQILTRWLDVRAAIVAELEGSDPGYLWIPTKPGRPRGGRPPVKPGLSRAAVRTLHAAHRSLVSQVRGSPLRPGAFRVVSPSHSRGAETRGQGTAQRVTLHNVHYRHLTHGSCIRCRNSRDSETLIRMRVRTV
jgi:integrase